MRKIEYNNNLNEIMDLLDGRFNIDNKYESIVKNILENVKKNKTKSIVEYTNQFDSPSFTKDDLKVTKQEIENAYKLVDNGFLTAIKKAKENIERFHKKQLRNSWMDFGDNGEMLGMKITPLDRVGLYVPGGTGGNTPLVSSVLMNGIPANIAGVDEIIMVTPPNEKNEISPFLLVAADIIGIKDIYKMGSAWAIGALAYGLEELKPVNKIVGPGNIYVTVAKKMVYGTVDIDMIAGPSEILIIADADANAKYIAADFLSQAEHDSMAASILITDSEEIAGEFEKEVAIQIEKLSRKDIAKESISKNGFIILVKDIEDAYIISNEIAPEHLEIQTKSPFESIPKVKNAGAMFLGEYTPEAIGDYFAGPNHVLPTNMTAKFYSPLNIDDFIKKTSVLYYPRRLFMENADHVIRIAEVEGLDAHANSIKIRKEES